MQSGPDSIMSGTKFNSMKCCIECCTVIHPTAEILVKHIEMFGLDWPVALHKACFKKYRFRNETP